MQSTSEKIRVDHLLVQRQFAPSRSRARDMIARGCVTINTRPVQKAGQLFSMDCTIAINDPAKNYVSRAALKLIAGLNHAGIDVEGQHAIDLGASTGGFTQVLLERGAASVLAVDVGHGQMSPRIAADPRVTNLEGLNARVLTVEHFPNLPSIVVSDVSFVSLTIAAEPTLRLCAPHAHCILLVKPQFEVGREGVGKGGLVSDDELIGATLERLSNWLSDLPGWTVTDVVPSPIKGGDGNREYLLCGVRHV